MSDVYRDIEAELAEDQCVPEYAIVNAEFTHDDEGLPRFANTPSTASLVAGHNRGYDRYVEVMQREFETSSARSDVYAMAAACLTEHAAGAGLSDQQDVEMRTLINQLEAQSVRILRPR